MYAQLLELPEHKIRVISPGHRRRLRQQGADLSRLRVRGVGVDDHRPPGEVGRGPLGEPDVDRVRARLRDARRDRRHRATGKILAVRVDALADHGAFNATAQPSRFPAGFFHVFTGSYDIEAAHCEVRGVYTNKAPGGVAYACSFRIAEAVYLVERLVDCLAFELELDPAELRLENLLAADQFPYESKTGWVYDSGDYAPALRKALEIAGYDELRAEQAEQARAGRADGDRAVVLHRGRRRRPAQAHGHPRSGDERQRRRCAIHPTGKAQLGISVQTQGQGHETTFAQIVAHELGIPPEDVEVVHGDTDTTPYGLGTYGSRSTPVRGAATAIVARKVRERARLVASAMLEVAPEDLEWENAGPGVARGS